MIRRILMTVVVTALLVATQASLSAQSLWSIGKVDTLTTGSCDDFNPTLVRKSDPDPTVDWNGNIWMLFERHTETTSAIIGKRYLSASAMWDSVEYTLASASMSDALRFPDLGKTWVSGGTLSLAAWQQHDGKVWQIWYSMQADSGNAWSTPKQITFDSTNCTVPQVRGAGYATFLVTWKRDNVLIGCLVTPDGVTAAGTLCVADTAAFEYDVVYAGGNFDLLWKSGGTPRRLVFQSAETSIPVIAAEAETLVVDSSIGRSHLVSGLYFFTEPGVFVCDGVVGDHDAVLRGDFGGSNGLQRITDDTIAQEGNAEALMFPSIAKRNLLPRGSFLSTIDLCVLERTAPGDSALIVMGNGWCDTIRSAGHNCNARISSQYLRDTVKWVPIVWESNRTGRSHIYAAFAYVWWYTGVADESLQPNVMSLAGNYPNPFNPATTITYSLSKRSHVTLTVYDLLGREVESLIDGEVQAGVSTVRLDARNLASGVYFYRIKSVPLDGSRPFVASRKCLVIK